MADKEPVYGVEAVELSTLKTDPPQLAILARGTARTSGWTDAELVEVVYVAPPADGVYEYELVARRPDGLVFQALTPIEASTERQSIPDDLKGIRVRAETNAVETTWSRPPR